MLRLKVYLANTTAAPATQMEGSFGTQKEHYAMRRIKARKKKTEILYIFFGIHTANAVHLAGRLAGLQETKAA